LHIVGKGNLNGLLLRGYYQTEFADMSKAYAVTDICLSRAGSNTLFELLALKIPSLIIPLPKGESRGDQVENAEYFYKQGLINYVAQESLSCEVFTSEIYKLYNEKNFLLTKLKRENIEIGNDKIIDILTKY
jgi:UDP-N-acetylglucosamine--N-acetylmuramyl-(pentapeptide) pyrophosphoryl-undecaprenol N-acetylglucosamine transferase